MPRYAYSIRLLNNVLFDNSVPIYHEKSACMCDSPNIYDIISHHIITCASI